MYEWDGASDRRIQRQTLRVELDEKLKAREKRRDGHIKELRALWMPLAIAVCAVCVAFVGYLSSL